jgi:hypothetical protein
LESKETRIYSWQFYEELYINKHAQFIHHLFYIQHQLYTLEYNNIPFQSYQVICKPRDGAGVSTLTQAYVNVGVSGVVSQRRRRRWRRSATLLQGGRHRIASDDGDGDGVVLLHTVPSVDVEGDSGDVAE